MKTLRVKHLNCFEMGKKNRKTGKVLSSGKLQGVQRLFHSDTIHFVENSGCATRCSI